MAIITNRDELKTEIVRLQLQKIEQEALLKKDWEIIQEKMKPMANAAGFVGQVFSVPKNPGILSSLVNIGLTLGTNKVLAGKIPFMLRALVSSVAGNIGARMTDQKSPGEPSVFSKIKTVFKNLVKPKS